MADDVAGEGAGDADEDGGVDVVMKEPEPESSGEADRAGEFGPRGVEGGEDPVSELNWADGEDPQGPWSASAWPCMARV